MLLVASVFAQPKKERPDKPGEGPRGEHFLQKIFENLDLSPEQKEKARAIQSETDENIKKLEADKSQSLGIYQQKKAELLEVRKKRFMELLNEEQRAKLEKMKEAGEANREERFEEKLKEWQTKLNLNGEQMEKIKELGKDFQQKRQRIEANDKLLPDEKRAGIKESVKMEMESIRSVLTPEQIEKFKAMQNERKEGGKKQPQKK